MITVMFLCFPVYVVAQIVAIVRLRGGWRWGSLLPVLPMFFVLVVTVKAFVQQSNLWPLLLLFSSPVALLYVLLVLGLFKLSNKQQGGTPA
jgi:hypothetical protein